MSIVVLQLPDAKRKSETRPKQCTYCQGETFQRWGKVGKPVRDKQYRTIQVYRYPCCHYRRSFWHYPVGMDQDDQTQRLLELATIYWVLGMSLRGVAIAVVPFGVKLNHMTVWRNLQDQAKRVEQRCPGRRCVSWGSMVCIPSRKGRNGLC